MLAAGCGDDDGPAPAANEAETELEITVDPDGDGPKEPLEGLIECPGGAAPPAACAAIAELPDDPAVPVPPDAICTEIYGGPDVVTLSGTLEGEPIDAELTRANGCEIDRFERFAGVLEALFPGYRPGSELKP